jgi:hypothetical protein
MKEDLINMVPTGGNLNQKAMKHDPRQNHRYLNPYLRVSNSPAY